jgi:serine protease
MKKINRARILCAPIKIGLIILVLITLASSVLAGVVKADSPFKINNVDNIEDIKTKLDNLKTKFVEDEIIVKFKGDLKPFRVIKVPDGKISEKINEYLQRKDVEYAEPNYIAYALMTPNDPFYKYQWNLYNPVYGGIQMEKAWDISTGSNSVVVAVVDTGIAYENYSSYCQAPDLAQTCFVPGYDFINNDSHPNDDNSHGTHVAGTIAQSTNNSLGVAGIAYNTCLMPVKVLNSSGSGSYAAVANGIRFAVDNGAKIINLSLGGSASDNTLKDAVQYAYQKGVTVIAACGNDNASNCLYPAAYDDYVIAVGATQYNETKAPYSSYGPSLDIVAPGGNTSVDQNGDGYGDGILQQTFKNSSAVCNFAYYFFQGTSMATPHVSGVVALLLAHGNATNPADIRAALQETAKDKGAPGRDNTYG